MDAWCGTRQFLIDAFHNGDDLCDPNTPSSIYADPTGDHEKHRWPDSHIMMSDAFACRNFSTAIRKFTGLTQPFTSHPLQMLTI